MNLAAMIAGLDLTLMQGDGDQTIVDLADDSRQVQPGWLFIARSGSQTDGNQYIQQAIAAGAAAIVSEQPPAPDQAEQWPNLAWIVGRQVNTPLASRLAGRFFGHPSRQLKLLGVTGTNGKTTTCYIVQHLLAQVGIRCGLIGTVQIDDGVARQPATLTTPGAVDLQRLLAAMVRNGCQAAVAEISSHALDQGRTADLTFHAGVFTNLTGDHLDYHQTMPRYAAAKARLFTQLAPQAWAIINQDDPWQQQVLADCPVVEAHRLTSSLKPQTAARLNAAIGELAATHTQVTLAGPWDRPRALNLPLAGRHNVCNAMQALAAAGSVTGQWEPLLDALVTCKAVPGRLEQVTLSDVQQADSLPTVLVDYAHTDDALRNVLTALRPVTSGRLMVLFGCGGDRDRSKRPRMAQVACELADLIMVTSDNPRTEDPGAIIDDILAGVPMDRKEAVQVEPDRGRAIDAIVQQAGSNDVVLLAGKGHEDYQIVGRDKRHFDDRLVAAVAMARRVGECLNQQVKQG